MFNGSWVLHITGGLPSFDHLGIVVIVLSRPEQAVTKMVQRASEFVDEIEDQDIKLKLIDTLRMVTVGKVST